jgi:hypothetical protein
MCRVFGRWLFRSHDRPFSWDRPLFTPLEIMPRCSAAGLDFRIIQAGFSAPLGFESQRLEFLTGFIQPF